jgi:hypothetical protein
MDKIDAYEYYFICYDCAAARDWTPRAILETIHMGVCPDCGEQKALVPVRAFDKARLIAHKSEVQG